jgi:hypothetical protein
MLHQNECNGKRGYYKMNIDYTKLPSRKEFCEFVVDSFKYRLNEECETFADKIASIENINSFLMAFATDQWQPEILEQFEYFIEGKLEDLHLDICSISDEMYEIDDETTEHYALENRKVFLQSIQLEVQQEKQYLASLRHDMNI